MEKLMNSTGGSQGSQRGALTKLLSQSGELSVASNGYMQDTRSSRLQCSPSHSPSRSNSGFYWDDEVTPQGMYLGPKSVPGKLKYRPPPRSAGGGPPWGRPAAVAAGGGLGAAVPVSPIGAGVGASSSRRRGGGGGGGGKLPPGAAGSGAWAGPAPPRVPLAAALDRADAAAAAAARRRARGGGATAAASAVSTGRFVGKPVDYAFPWAAPPQLLPKLTSPLVGKAFSRAELGQVNAFWEDHFGHPCPYSKTKTLAGGRRKSQPSCLGEHSRTRGGDAAFAEPKFGRNPSDLDSVPFQHSLHRSKSSLSRYQSSNFDEHDTLMSKDFQMNRAEPLQNITEEKSLKGRKGGQKKKASKKKQGPESSGMEEDESRERSVVLLQRAASLPQMR